MQPLPPPLPRSELLALVKQAQAGDRLALQKIIRHNLRYIHKLAAVCVQKYGGDLDDYVQEGTLGLMRAVAKYDLKRKNTLLTYATHWIQVYMDRLAMHDASQVQRGVKEKRAKRIPSDQSMESSRVGQAVIHTMASDIPTPEEQVLEQDRQRRIWSRVHTELGKLNRRDRAIVTHRLMAEDPQTLAQLGETLGFCRERIRQLQFQAVRRLQRRLEDTADTLRTG